MCCEQNEHHKSEMHHEHSSTCNCKCGHSKHGNLEEYKTKLENELAIVNEKLAEIKGE
ncbi:hypothetical protein [Methanolobus vulcani]|uniref:hypothetical protein n=1 Tax=Methanolobus vulcani TaxID=38026 RepID=UPI0012B91A1B|nr:hypothetical protein [Methanolobus vulcani]